MGVIFPKSAASAARYVRMSIPCTKPVTLPVTSPVTLPVNGPVIPELVIVPTFNKLFPCASRSALSCGVVSDARSVTPVYATVSVLPTSVVLISAPPLIVNAALSSNTTLPVSAVTVKSLTPLSLAITILLSSAVSVTFAPALIF